MDEKQKNELIKAIIGYLKAERECGFREWIDGNEVIYSIGEEIMLLVENHVENLHEDIWGS